MFNPADVPSHLVQKYSQRVPRYTSYPTAPHFREDVKLNEIIRSWENSNPLGDAKEKPISVYMHIPFCAERCWFCGCTTTISKKNERANPYIDTIVQEFKNSSDVINPERPLQQLAIGGGTPNFLNPEQIHSLFKEFFSVWTRDENAELSVELDPRTMSEEKLLAFLEHGFNRFSMGVQDFDEQVLNAIHRHQSLEQTVALVEILRKHGISAYNFDLIYGLPAQTVESMHKTIETVIKYRPSRIALYSYAHVPWMKSHQKLLEKHHLPTPDEKMAIFGMAYEQLTKNGYVHIGMDHFALPSDELAISLEQKTLHRNFMGYTTRRGLDLLAFGSSSISSVGGAYAQNVKEEKTYREKIATEKFAIERGYILSQEDVMRRELIIDLFCNFYLDTELFEKKWQIDFAKHFAPELEQLQNLQQDGLLRLDSQKIEVSEMGRALIRNVCVVFDQYMEKDPSKRTYSQAV